MSSESKPIRRELSGLAKLALPIAVAQAGQSMMGMVDTAVAGRAGTEVLGAVGLANAIFFAIGSFGLGAMMGLDPLISQAIGSGHGQRARRLLWQGVWLATLLFALIGPLLLLLPQGMSLIGVDPSLIPEARAYLLWRAPSFLPLCLYGALRSYLQGRGRTAPVVWAAVIANLFNLGADVILVLGGSVLPEWAGPLRSFPAMGASGAAIATTLCSILQVGIMAFGIRFLETPADAARRRPRWPELRESFRVGLPIGLHLLAEVGVFALSGMLAARLGQASMAAHQVALTYGSLAFTFALGIGNAASTRVGWAVGRGDDSGARRSAWVAFGAGVTVMTLSAAVFLIVPNGLVRLMTNQPEVWAVAVPLMLVAAVFQIADGVQGVGAGVLRGVGDTRFTFVANLIGHYLVGLPIALWLGFSMGWGVHGIWWGLCAGLFVVAIALVLRFRSLGKRPFVALAARSQPGAAAA